MSAQLEAAAEVPTEVVQGDPKEVGYDFLWPPDEDSQEMVSLAIGRTVVDKGYCVIQMSQSTEERDDVLIAMSQPELQDSFLQLDQDSHDSYLGNGKGRSNVATVGTVLDSEDPLASYVNSMGTVGTYMSNMAEMVFGFAPADSIQGHSETGLMFREAASRRTDPSLFRPSQSYEEVDAEAFLNFIRCRKLCMMHFLSCKEEGGVVELSPLADAPFAAVSLQVVENQLLIFRHDAMNYAYTPGGRDLVLQGWVFQEPVVWTGGVISGKHEMIKYAIGAEGVRLPQSNAVQVKSMSGRIGGHGVANEKITSVYSAMCDVAIKIPPTRWDHDHYWSPNRDDGRGLSGVRHCGMCQDADIMCFDYQKFGFDEEVAKVLGPTNFMNIECGYETLRQAGWTLKTLKGQQMDVSIGGQFRESEGMLRMVTWASIPISSVGSENDIVMHTFGLTGKSTFIDTACSASNVALNIMYQDMRVGRDAHRWHMPKNGMCRSQKGLAIGIAFQGDPFPFVGLSQAHMISSRGRSRSHDQSGDGYCRGEGVGCMYICVDTDAFDRYAYIIGGCCNQDGRSASLTAPSGPSQIEMHRMSLRDAGQKPLDVNLCELHATGTAIGDPIEANSLRAVMANGRVTPLVHHAGKPVTGHLECGAGVTGVMRTILSCLIGTSFTNGHIKQINPNVDIEAFPALFCTEATPLAEQFCHSGISSFGFGGTNSRTEVMTVCQLGGNRVAPCGRIGQDDAAAVIDMRTCGKRFNPNVVDVFLTPCAGCHRTMCFLCGEAGDAIPAGKHRCSAVRKDAFSYGFCSACYAGEYVLGRSVVGDAGDLGLPVYIVGSWSGFAKYEEMKKTAHGYEVDVDVGDVRYANFRIVLEKDPSRSIYPYIHEASQFEKDVLGPDGNAGGRSWTIDVANECGGSKCRISLTWDYGTKSISWKGLDVAPETVRTLAPQTYKPTYSVSGTFNGWRLTDLQHKLTVEQQEDIWETTFEFSFSGQAEFQFVVDHDPNQVIFPDGESVVDQSVPLFVGYADRSACWYLCGLIGEVCTLQLRSTPEGLCFTLASETAGIRRWYTPEFLAAHEKQYYLTGDFNDWAVSPPMEPDPSFPFVYWLRGITYCGPAAEFMKVVLDEDDTTKTLSGCMCLYHGLSFMRDDDDPDMYGYYAKSGTKFEVRLDVRWSQPVLSLYITDYAEDTMPEFTVRDRGLKGYVGIVKTVRVKDIRL